MTRHPSAEIPFALDPYEREDAAEIENKMISLPSICVLNLLLNQGIPLVLHNIFQRSIVTNMWVCECEHPNLIHLRLIVLSLASSCYIHQTFCSFSASYSVHTLCLCMHLH